MSSANQESSRNGNKLSSILKRINDKKDYANGPIHQGLTDTTLKYDDYIMDGHPVEKKYTGYEQMT